MIMSSSRFPFTYGRLLQRKNGTFQGFGQDWSPPNYNDPNYWKAPAPTTSTGIPYYLADPSSGAGGETVYVTPTSSDAGAAQAGGGTAGSSGVADFFMSLVGGVMGSFKTPSTQPQQMYYPPPSSGPPAWLIGAGVVLGAGTLYVLLKK